MTKKVKTEGMTPTMSQKGDYTYVSDDVGLKKAFDHLKLEQSPKIFVTVPLAQTYLEVLDQLLSSVFIQSATSPSSLIPFVVTCAAGLECLLNDHLIQHCGHVFGLKSYDRFAKAFLAMPLRGKLDSSIPLFTGNRCTLRQDGRTYQRLVRLIKLRNDLMHGKAHIKECDVSIQHQASDATGFSFKIPQNVHRNITLDNCSAFLDALKELNSLLSSINKLRDGQPITRDCRNMLVPLPRLDKDEFAVF